MGSIVWQKVLGALRDYVGVGLTVASGVALVAGELAHVPAPLGVPTSVWAYVAVIGASSQLLVTALTRLSSILGVAIVHKAAVEAVGRVNVARVSAGVPISDATDEVRHYIYSTAAAPQR